MVTIHAVCSQLHEFGMACNTLTPRQTQAWVPPSWCPHTKVPILQYMQ